MREKLRDVFLVLAVLYAVSSTYWCMMKNASANVYRMETLKSEETHHAHQVTAHDSSCSARCALACERGIKATETNDAAHDEQLLSNTAAIASSSRKAQHGDAVTITLRRSRQDGGPILLNNVLRIAGYKCQEKTKLIEHLHGQAVVVEVGAYDGQEAQKLAPHCRKLYTFEATPSKRATIERAVKDYSDRVEVHMKAVGDKTGTVQLHLPDGDRGAQQDSIGDQSFWSGKVKTIDVPMVKLDDMIKERVHMLKVDTQGHEFHVLRGAERLIREYGVDILHLEYSPKLMRSSGGDPVEFLHYVRELGYHCMDCAEFSPPPMMESRAYEEYGNAFGQFNFRRGDHGKWGDIVCFQL